MTKDYYYYEEESRRFAILQKMVSLGVPKKDVHHFIFPLVDTGYSMGGETEVFVSGSLVMSDNNKQHYARSCNYSAKHGYVRIDFTKKDLKQYVKICKELDNAWSLVDKKDNNETRAIYVNALSLYKDFVEKHINRKHSEIKRGTKFFVTKEQFFK